MRIIRLDGSPEAAGTLAAAVADALDGGPAVLPLEAAAPPYARVPPPVAASDRPLTAGTGCSSRPPAPPACRGWSCSRPPRCGPPRTATAARLGGPGRWLLALPADHVAGVQVVVRALLAGAAPVVQDLRGGFRPDGFAAATARLGPGRRYTSLVPTQLLRLLDAGGSALEALRGYDAVLVGGAALDAGLRARAEAAGVRIVTTYGMTETAGGCVYDGLPLGGVRVRMDADGSRRDRRPDAGGRLPRRPGRDGGRVRRARRRPRVPHRRPRPLGGRPARGARPRRRRHRHRRGEGRPGRRRTRADRTARGAGGVRRRPARPGVGRGRRGRPGRRRPTGRGRPAGGGARRPRPGRGTARAAHRRRPAAARDRQAGPGRGRASARRRRRSHAGG